MNSVHDMGGMHGMGPLQIEENEPVFHEDWEGRVYALTRVLRLGPKWNIDMSRYSMEQLPPAVYLGSSYYKRWLLGLEKRLLGAGVLAPEELEDFKARSQSAGASAIHKMSPEEVRSAMKPWRAAQPEADLPPKFKPGDRVRARNINPVSHTRLPRYVRGHLGVVDRDLGVHMLPDAWVAQQEKRLQHVYSVRFEARELWGADASGKNAMYLDLWDDYLDLA